MSAGFLLTYIASEPAGLFQTNDQRMEFSSRRVARRIDAYPTPAAPVQVRDQGQTVNDFVAEEVPWYYVVTFNGPIRQHEMQIRAVWQTQQVLLH